MSAPNTVTRDEQSSSHRWEQVSMVSIVKTKVARWQHDGRGEWPVEHEYFVYSGEKLIRVCPSLGMAREVAAGVA